MKSKKILAAVSHKKKTPGQMMTKNWQKARTGALTQLLQWRRIQLEVQAATTPKVVVL